MNLDEYNALSAALEAVEEYADQVGKDLAVVEGTLRDLVSRVEKLEEAQRHG